MKVLITQTCALLGIGALTLVGSMPAKAADWTVTGVIQVEEKTSTGNTVFRPLKGVSVRVSGANVGRAYAIWGTVHTDENGRFTLKEKKNNDDRHIKVQVRLRDSSNKLDVNRAVLDNPFDNEWSKVYETGDKVDGPSVNVGTRVFRVSAGGELGGDYARRAAIYYYAKSAMDHLAAKGGGIQFTDPVNFAYPAKVISSSYANGATRTAYIKATDADADTVLHELMHLWNYQHNSGTTNWLDAVWGDQSTHSFQEEPNVAFHEGFAEWAKNELCAALWSWRKVKPANRKSLNDKKLTSLSVLERYDKGVMHALHLLTTPNIHGWTFGTKSKEPAGAGATGGGWDFRSAVQTSNRISSESPRVDFYDVLRVFLAHPSKGHAKMWEVGSKSRGLVAFYSRATDILGASQGLTDANKQLLLDLLNVDKTREP